MNKPLFERILPSDVRETPYRAPEQLVPHWPDAPSQPGVPRRLGDGVDELVRRQSDVPPGTREEWWK